MFRFTLSVFSSAHPNTVYVVQRENGDPGKVQQGTHVYDNIVEIEDEVGLNLYKFPLRYTITQGNIVICNIKVTATTNALGDTATWTTDINDIKGAPMIKNNEVNPNEGEIVGPNIIAGVANIEIGV